MYLIKVLKAVIGSLNSRNDKQYKIQWPKDKRRNNDTQDTENLRLSNRKPTKTGCKVWHKGKHGIVSCKVWHKGKHGTFSNFKSRIASLKIIELNAI
jgi:hypothetical protein